MAPATAIRPSPAHRAHHLAQVSARSPAWTAHQESRPAGLRSRAAHQLTPRASHQRPRLADAIRAEWGTRAGELVRRNCCLRTVGRAADSAGPTPSRPRDWRGSAINRLRRDPAMRRPDSGSWHWLYCWIAVQVQLAPRLASCSAAAQTNHREEMRRGACCQARPNHRCRWGVARRVGRRCAAARRSVATARDRRAQKHRRRNQTASDHRLCWSEKEKGSPAGEPLFGRSNSEPARSRRTHLDGCNWCGAWSAAEGHRDRL